MKSRLGKSQEINPSMRGLPLLPLLLLFTGARFLKLSKKSSYLRYLEISLLPFKPLQYRNEESPPLEILFVSTRKDFEVLIPAIRYALEATSHHTILSVNVIVPEIDYLECKELIRREPREIKVIIEDKFIDDRNKTRIRNRFRERSGWVIQQIIKDRFICKSEAQGVLVVDSDTILLEPRNWLTNEGVQILTPTWEFHPAYYKFLYNLKVSKLRPKYTFVSHHMLMQPKIMREIFQSLGWTNLDDFIESLTEVQLDGEKSPFSIDYELYAQYLMKNYPEKVILEKWSNFSYARSLQTDTNLNEDIDRKFRDRYASVSLHSYLN